MGGYASHAPSERGSAQDPHSPRDGGWWAHAGWVLVGEASHDDTAAIAKHAPDLAKHRFYIHLNNYHWVPMIALAAVLFAAGGLSLVLWGICFRVVFGLHATWFVNSASHMWGRRRFATRDESRNNWWVALITFGEGWHNNHHAHPTSARRGRLGMNSTFRGFRSVSCGGLVLLSPYRSQERAWMTRERIGQARLSGPAAKNKQVPKKIVSGGGKLETGKNISLLPLLWLPGKPSEQL